MNSTSRQKTLVVVDEDREIHDLIRAYFTPKGFQVIGFTDAPLTLKEGSRSGQNWDVLLTDFHLSNPEVGFGSDIAELLPHLHVIPLSTAGDSPANAACGVARQLPRDERKKIECQQLQHSLDRALSGKTTLIRRNDTGVAKEIQKEALIGSSPNFLTALETARRVAPSKASIFISGESGTGKELFARFIHNRSQHCRGPFVAINCSAIPEGLLESELFGHAKGAFTGASLNKIGLFEEAQDGTLFLDEIGDLSLSLQAKLLRVLQDRQIKRVGENHCRPINCRIISATHKDLPLEVFHSRFREDLFFRLIVIPIALPPLRERKDDLLPLAEFFLLKFARENNSNAKTLSADSMKFILENQWRGNVRELENAVERAVILSNESEISLDHFTPLLSDSSEDAPRANASSADTVFQIQCAEHLASLNEVTQRYIEFAVRQNGGARDKTAKDIGIDRKTLYKRLRLEGGPLH